MISFLIISNVTLRLKYHYKKEITACAYYWITARKFSRLWRGQGYNEKTKKVWPREKLLFRYGLIYSNHHTFDCHIFHGVSKIKIREVVICLNCIIGLSSTAENNSLCNHIKRWWQIAFENWIQKGNGHEGFTINDIGHMHLSSLI